MASVDSLIMLIIVGLVPGWLSGLIWKGQGFGLIGSLVIGIAGSFIVDIFSIYYNFGVMDLLDQLSLL